MTEMAELLRWVTIGMFRNDSRHAQFSGTQTTGRWVRMGYRSYRVRHQLHHGRPGVLVRHLAGGTARPVWKLEGRDVCHRLRAEWDNEHHR